MSNIIVSKAHGAIIVPFVPAVANIVPGAKGLMLNGKPMLAMPHDTAGTQLLRAYGIDAPAPVLHHYDWANAIQQPYDVQRRTVALLTTNKRAYVLNGFGTGKTKSALWAADWLMSQGVVRRTLVVAPLSTLTFTWAREVLQTIPHRRAVVLHGSREKRLKLCEEDADIYIVNHDGLAIVQQTLKERGDIDLVVLDELAKYRNGSAFITKTTARFVKDVPWVWGMTGGPTPNEPVDAHAQIRMLTPEHVDPSMTRFREATMLKVSQFKWVARHNAMDTVFAAMQPSVRFTLDDVVELPDLIMRFVEVAQGSKQTEVYNALLKQAKVQVASGAITAVNAGVLQTKLLQVASGWVYTNDHGVVHLDNEDRLDALIDAISQTKEKVIVFAPYTHCIKGLADEIRQAGFTVETVEGDVSKSRRDDIFNRFQNTFEPKVIVAHPGTMAHGLTLTAADTIAWFGPINDLEIFDQANARIRRIGQKKKQQILMFTGTPIERLTYNRLRSKQSTQNLLLQMFEDDTISKQ